MKLFLFLILLFSSVSKLNSQVFYLKINDEFQTEKIECIPVGVLFSLYSFRISLFFIIDNMLKGVWPFPTLNE